MSDWPGLNPARAGRLPCKVIALLSGPSPTAARCQTRGGSVAAEAQRVWISYSSTWLGGRNSNILKGEEVSLTVAFWGNDRISKG